MARGDREQRCLERVKRRVFPNAVVQKAYDADMALFHSSAFGFSLEDWRSFCIILASAEPNNEPSKFPDFRCANSVIEHFEITATSEGKKGSTFKRGHEPFIKSVEKDVDDALASNDPKTFVRTFCYPDRNHALLLDSLEHNLKGHIASLEAYAVSHEVTTSVFVIEYQERGLEMIENIYEGIGGGRGFGDLREQQKFKNYRMSTDRKALELLYVFADKLDIVVFAGVDDIEIIKLSEIPSMLKLMPWPFVVAAGVTLERHSFLPVLQVVDTTRE